MDTHEHTFTRPEGANYETCDCGVTQEIAPPPPRQEAYPNLNAGGPGRKSLYKPEYCQMLREHMKTGLSLESFGGVVNVSRETLYEWQKEHSEFSDTYNEAKSLNLLFWERLGVQGTAGKLPGFNASTYALNMANRHRWFSSKQDITSDGEKIDNKTVIMLPTKLKIEDTNPQEIENND